MKKSLICSILIVCAAWSVYAQQTIKTVSAARVKIDGTVQNSEYEFTTTMGKLVFSASCLKDATLFLGIQAETKGWVAVGLGSSVMNNAFIIIGYDRNGSVQVKEQQGSGRSHRDVSGTSLSEWAVREADRITTLEIKLSGKDYIDASTGKIDFIVAFGPADDFSSYHSFRRNLSLKIE